MGSRFQGLGVYRSVGVGAGGAASVDAGPKPNG